MNQEAFNLEVRLTALEYLVLRLYALTYIANNQSQEKIKEGHGRMLAHFRTQKFPSNDPAMSGLISGELEDRLTSLLGVIEKIAEQLRK